MTAVGIAEDDGLPPHGNMPSRNRRMSTANALERVRSGLAGDGIVNIRSRSYAVSQDQRLNRSGKELVDEDDDPDLRRPSDFKYKQVRNPHVHSSTYAELTCMLWQVFGRYLFWLAYQSFGVIYGDIGTSPLYVYSTVFSAPPSKKDLVGVLSLIIWSLSIMVTVKYILCILYFDNDGEGGSFSTYSLLSRYLNITNRDPREATMVRMERIKSGELNKGAESMRRRLENSRLAKRGLQVVGILAVTAIIADGILTPAQSVLGAVQGIEVVKPDISKSTVLGVTNAILIFLFAIQSLGISRVTVAFSPIILIWLTFNAVSAIYNLAKYDASVFVAFNPGLAFEFLIDKGQEGWRLLGGVLLAFTGVEALFADLGAFSRRAIQISWLCYTYPCLLLAYIGQAAYISVHPEAYSNPFFNSVPDGTLYFSLVLAILAAIVASQAIITATFQLLAQVMKLSYFPQLKVVHTSTTFHGQLYMPLANWLLMIGTVLVASIYNNTTSLGNAYGVCVMLVTFFDTSMVSLAAIFVFNIPPYYVFLPWLTIACFDGAFLSSALEKVPAGAWFTLSLAALLAIVFLTWRFGKEQQWKAEAEDRFPTTHFVEKSPDGKIQLTEQYSNIPLSEMRGFGVFFDKAGETTPIVFSQFAIKLTTLPEIMVFFHLRPLEHPSVEPEERFSISRLAIPNCFRVVCRHGYNDTVMTPDLGAVIYQHLRSFLIARADSSHGCSPDSRADMSGFPADSAPTPTKTAPPPVLRSSATLDEELSRLDMAFQHNVLYIIGKESLRIKPSTNILRRIFLWAFLWMRENSRGKIADLRLPREDVVEMGFLKEI
ncbi:hypothetical protein ANO11243_094590 [Dothideomycetidae sp. 11243]|nr:hypothetical protein ANO11243_094590 [fungal sp. No.11243]